MVSLTRQGGTLLSFDFSGGEGVGCVCVGGGGQGGVGVWEGGRVGWVCGVSTSCPNLKKRGVKGPQKVIHVSSTQDHNIQDSSFF